MTLLLVWFFEYLILRFLEGESENAQLFIELKLKNKIKSGSLLRHKCFYAALFFANFANCLG